MSSDYVRLQTAISENSGVFVIKIAGEVDVYTSPDLKTAIYKAIDDGAKDLVIDLADVGYMDSSGFGTLLGATKKLKPNGGSINLVSCSEAIQRMLHITRLDTIFGVFPDVDVAIDSVTSKCDA